MFDRMVDGEGESVSSPRPTTTAWTWCEDGLRETLDFLDSKGYPHIGTARGRRRTGQGLPGRARGDQDRLPVEHLRPELAAAARGPRSNLGQHVRSTSPNADISPIAGQCRGRAGRGRGCRGGIAALEPGVRILPGQKTWSRWATASSSLGIDVIVGKSSAQRAGPWNGTATRTRPRKAAGRPHPYALGNLLSIHRTLPDSRLACLARVRIIEGEKRGTAEGKRA
jgi:hypothetical protein